MIGCWFLSEASSSRQLAGGATGTAERTSPTNIGLAMLSVLAAYDLHLCTRDRAVGLIENILSTVGKAPKMEWAFIQLV